MIDEPSDLRGTMHKQPDRAWRHVANPKEAQVQNRSLTASFVIMAPEINPSLISHISLGNPTNTQNTLYFSACKWMHMTYSEVYSKTRIHIIKTYISKPALHTTHDLNIPSHASFSDIASG